MKNEPNFISCYFNILATLELLHHLFSSYIFSEFSLSLLSESLTFSYILFPSWFQERIFPSSKPHFVVIWTDSRLKQAFDNLFTKGLKVQENRVREDKDEGKLFHEISISKIESDFFACLSFWSHRQTFEVLLVLPLLVAGSNL